MDVPIGALGDGFEDRLVLESRGDLARWGGVLLYVLMVPAILVFAGILSLLLVGGVMFCLPLELRELWSVLYLLSVFLMFIGMIYYLGLEYRTRDFQEIALRDLSLEVTGKAPREVVDVKCWPHGMSFVCRSGERYMVRCSSEEKKLQVMERLVPPLAAVQRGILDSGGEIRLERSWVRLFSMLLQATFLGGMVLVLGLFAHFMVGIALGVLAWAWYFFPALRDFSNRGLILSRTGLRRLGEPVEREVAWGDIKLVWTGTFFQDTLRVSSGTESFTLLSARNSVVWALVIRDLTHPGEVGKGRGQDC